MRRSLVVVVAVLLLPSPASAGVVDAVAEADHRLLSLNPAEYLFEGVPAGDLDGDGHDDLLLVGENQATAGWFQLSGVAVFGPLAPAGPLDGVRRTVMDTDEGLVALAGAGDVDGDGRDDLLAGGYWGRGGTGPTTALLLSTGRSAPRRGFDVSAAGTQLDLVPLGDVSGDGRADLGARTRAGRSFVVFGKADDAPVHLDSLGDDGYELRGGTVMGPAGDVDGDGRADLVVDDRIVFGKAGSEPVDVTDPSAGVTLTPGQVPVAVGDIDADGRDDVAAGRADGTVRVAFAGRPGGFDVTGAAGKPAAAGDVTGDGRDDLLVGDALVFGRTATTAVRVDALGTAGIRFETGSLLEEDWPAGVHPLAGVGDVIGDDRPDILAGSFLLDANTLVQAASGCTVIGTARADVLHGTPASDVLCGFGGNDRIAGLGGDDVLLGGPGSDRLEGGPGDDRTLGGDQADVVLGGEDQDRVIGSDGADRVDGGSGADAVLGAGGRDRLLGQAGDDEINGGLDRDTLDGGPGDDLGYGAAGADIVRGRDGDDRLYGRDASYGYGTDRAADTVIGDDGDDVLRGGGGAGRVDGGDGDDVLFGPGAGTVLLGGTGNDGLVGDTGRQRLFGGDGDDVLRDWGADDRDFFKCGRGVDRAYGEPGDVVAADCEEGG